MSPLRSGARDLAIGLLGPRRPIALWQLGFRPFYFLASLFAAISIPVWVVQAAGHLPVAYVGGPLWHGYEMLFGYTTAVIAGFLLTAVRAWSGQPTVTGGPLAALAALWLGGRILVCLPYPQAAMIVNAAFPLAVAIAVAVPLLRAASRRNYFVIVFLVLLGAASLLFQLTGRGIVRGPALPAMQAGLDIVLVLLAVIAGRVVPMFSNHGIPGLHARRHPLLEKVALGSVALLVVADLVPPPPFVLAALACSAAAVHLARLILWQPWRTRAVPLVWILHAAYVWVVAYLLLRGLAALGVVPLSLALHALTVGAIGSATIGMMARTSLGHTGRPLIAGRLERASFLLLQGAALARIAGGLLATGSDVYRESVMAAGLLWSAAFLLFTLGYAAVWMGPRRDGKPG